MLALLVAVSGTAVEVAGRAAALPETIGFMAKVQSWAIGIGGAIVLGIALKWVLNKGIDLLMDWQLREVQKLLHANTGDPALDTFVADIVLAVAKLAQAKFPKGGLGPERLEYLVQFLTVKLPLFKGKEDLLREIANRVVAREQELLNTIRPQQG